MIRKMNFSVDTLAHWHLHLFLAEVQALVGQLHIVSCALAVVRNDIGILSLHHPLNGI